MSWIHFEFFSEPVVCGYGFLKNSSLFFLFLEWGYDYPNVEWWWWWWRADFTSFDWRWICFSLAHGHLATKMAKSYVCGGEIKFGRKFIMVFPEIESQNFTEIIGIYKNLYLESLSILFVKANYLHLCDI